MIFSKLKYFKIRPLYPLAYVFFNCSCATFSERRKNCSLLSSFEVASTLSLACAVFYFFKKAEMWQDEALFPSGSKWLKPKNSCPAGQYPCSLACCGTHPCHCSCLTESYACGTCMAPDSVCTYSPTCPTCLQHLRT